MIGDALLAIVAGLAIGLVGIGMYELATRPTCEERGGHQVRDGDVLIPMHVGNVMTLMPYPNYRCEGAKR